MALNNEQYQKIDVYYKLFLNTFLNNMKKIYTLSVVVLLFAGWTQQLQGQTTQSGLNQVELLKQFIGTLENATNKDTVYTAEIKPFGNGALEFRLKSVAHGMVWLEERQLWGYDKKNDKIVCAGIMKDSPNIMLQSAWFTEKNKFKQVPLEFASNPEQAGFIVLFDLKSPDLVIREEFVNNKSLGQEKYTRIKN
jgi:hypothetical protein